MSIGHSHAPPNGDAGGPALRKRQHRALWIALWLNAVFLVVEAVGGFVFGSLALIADAAHMFTDVVGLSIAVVAARLADRPATKRHTYGLQRAEVLAAQANGLLILLAAAFIIYEAIQRIGSHSHIDGVGLLVIATLGLLVNLVPAWLLLRVEAGNINVRGAYVHLVTDALASVAAIAAGIAVIIWNAAWVDTLMSLVIGAIVIWAAWGLLRDATRVLLEAAPRGFDISAATEALCACEHVASAHHVHVWSIGTDKTALSAHLVMSGSPSVADSQACVQEAKTILHDEFGVEHVTLELETDACGDNGAGAVDDDCGTGKDAGDAPA